MSQPVRFDPLHTPAARNIQMRSAWLESWSLDLISKRGWLVAGFAGLCLFLAYILGRHELMALGCALMALVLGAWLLVRFSSPAIELHRTLPQEPVSVGQVASIELHCLEEATVREVLPPQYPATPTFHAPGSFGYEMVFRRRGVHQLGPAQQVLADPCGLVHGLVSTGISDDLAVRSAVLPLGSSSTLGERMLTGEARHTQSAEVDYYDVGIREHHQGDSIRQVHWKATARHGKLMVRQENYVATAHSLIILDRRQNAWHTPADQPVEIPQTAGLSSVSTQRFEKALSLTCSIASHYANRGYQILVQDSTGENLGARAQTQVSAVSAREGFEDFHAATSTLELIQDAGATTPDELFSESLNRTLLGFADEPVFLVLGELTEEQARGLASLSGTVRNVDLFLISAHPKHVRDLARHFAATPWRFHLPASSSDVAQIWAAP